MQPMEAMMQFNWEQKDGSSVPSPYDKTGKSWLYDKGAHEAFEISHSGVTDLLTPPVGRGQSMGAGYDPYNHYDLGMKNPVRHGSREGLQRLSAVWRSNGGRIHIDNVLAHMDGGTKAGVVEYDGGRFPKTGTCFVGGNVKKDAVADPAGDFAYVFGRQIAYQYGWFGDGIGDHARGYMLREMIKNLQWRYKAVQAAGGRFDNTKSMAPGVLHRMLSSDVLKGTFGVGEYYDGNPDTLSWWVFNSGIQGLCGTFDFDLYFVLRDLCNNARGFSINRLVNAGICQRFAEHAMTFAENHDTDTSESPVIWNKAMAYFIIMMFTGVPCIYYKDWSSDPGCYNLKSHIKNYLWIRRMLAGGTLTWRYAGRGDLNVVGFSRDSYGDKPGVLCLINKDPDNWHEVKNVQTPFAPNTRLNDYSGHADQVWTDWQGKIASAWVPPNVNGHGTVAYAPDGYQNKTFTVPSLWADQEIEGAEDLARHDIGPAIAQKTTNVMKIFVEGETTPTITFKSNDEGLKTQLVDATGKVMTNRVPTDDWYGIQIVSTRPDTVPFTLNAHYKAPSKVALDEVKAA
jgi:alpha-amylase